MKESHYTSINNLFSNKNMPQIIVTVGPATSKPEVLKKLHDLGVRMLRFNFVHSTPENTQPVLDMIHELEKTVSEPFQLMMDLEWPSIRTGELATPRDYKKWEIFKLKTSSNLMDNDLFCDYSGIINDVEIGSLVRIESGLFDAIVREKWPDYIVLEAQNDFTMTSKRHINLPAVHINLPTITEKDYKDVLYGIEKGFSYMALSFCRSGDDVRNLRTFVEDHSKNLVKFVAKVENQEGLDNLDDIADASDVVMVARWDLGTEVPLETIPEIQMDMVKTCQLKNTPVIVATQMMESMVKSPAPTRAEVSDVFLAVREGADFVMLSEETTVGQYPLETVTMMNKIIEEAL